MNCLITGSLGFIGAHLANALIRDGHNVVGYDDNSAVSTTRSGAITIQQDISTRITPLEGIDVVFNTAAISRTVPCTDNPLRCNQVNVVGALNVFRAYPKARIVHCSSNVVYGSPTPYRASKRAVEEYAESFNALYGANIICMRFSNVIGPGLRKGDPAVLSALRDTRDEKGYIEITGDGTQTRNFTFVADIADACVKAAESTYKGNLDVTSGIVTNMNEFGALFGCPIRYVGEREGDTKNLEQSPANARLVLGWSATTGLEDAVRMSLV